MRNIFVPALGALALAVSAESARADDFRIGQLAFQSCTLGEKRADTLEAWCTTFEVAEDPAKPDGRRINLNVAVVPARSPKPKADLLVFLAGGPGQAAIEAYPKIEAGFQPLLRDRHLLLVDQRGTGGSNRLACPQAPEDVLDDAQGSSTDAFRRQAEDCLAAVRDHADPRHYTTSNAIRDLETLRAALGNPQYNLVGGSYGSRVALSYLRAKPDSLRSVIVDGVVPQDEPLGQSHARNLDDGLAAIFAACREDKTCSARFGDPAATLSALRLKLREAPMLVTLPDPLTHAPVTRTLGEFGLVGVVRLYSYAPESAALLPLLIDEAAKGRAEALVAQGLIISRDLGKQLAHGMELSVICAEDAPELRERPEDEARLIGNLLPKLILAQCPVWPTGTRPEGFKQPVVSDKPVLLLSGEWDPVTPPRFADAAAKTLSNSRHLVAKGRGHIVLQRGCMAKLAAKFVDELKPAALDASCLDVLGRIPPFTSYLGPQP
ncbi:alpha/beta hydrolase [Nevskia sp.]|uniref:alpha/beta hydrolase n=1 Tax=Nevskia sp. TaxID=1929292 RepID=UPI0025EAEC99|nr:alpha/beta hydrolase [Nevskia sp.]